MKRTLLKCGALLTMLTVSPLVLAQRGPSPAQPSGPPPTAQQAARVDLTGYWVSVVTEDWRWRMLTAPTGDIEGVPLNGAGRQLAQQFDGGKYGSPWTNKIDCRAYYGAGLMRMPTRLRITWAGPEVLKIESDWGQQIRLLHFKRADLPNAGLSPQGSSYATWQLAEQGLRGFGGQRSDVQDGGKLYVVTDNLSPGWLRRNGVPYSEKARMSEWFQTFEDPTGKVWFNVTTKIDDPEYLASPYITSSDFRKEPDGSKWLPHPCVQSD